MLTLLAAGLSLALYMKGAPANGITTISGAIAVDRPSLFLWGTLLALGFAALLLIADRTTERGGYFVAHNSPGDVSLAQRTQQAMFGGMQTEVFPLMLFALGGMMTFTAANDLLTMFIALEVLSLPLYLMCGLARRRRLISQEAALKYFLLGAFASAFFLYGLALLYGYAELGEALRHRQRGHRHQPLRRAAVRRSGPAGRRPAVQGVGRSVPHLDPGRLPGRADPDDRVHGRLHQGRRVRRRSCGC